MADLRQALVNLALRRLPAHKVIKGIPPGGRGLTPDEIRRRMIAMYHGVVPARDTPGLVVLATLPVSSTWVRSISLVLVGGHEEVMLTFLDGAKCHYPGTDKSDYAYILAAPSKGKAVWAQFYRKPYVLR